MVVMGLPTRWWLIEALRVGARTGHPLRDEGVLTELTMEGVAPG